MDAASAAPNRHSITAGSSALKKASALASRLRRPLPAPPDRAALDPPRRTPPAGSSPSPLPHLPCGRVRAGAYLATSIGRLEQPDRRRLQHRERRRCRCVLGPRPTGRRGRRSCARQGVAARSADDRRARRAGRRRPRCAAQVETWPAADTRRVAQPSSASSNGRYQLTNGLAWANTTGSPSPASSYSTGQPSIATVDTARASPTTRSRHPPPIDPHRGQSVRRPHLGAIRPNWRSGRVEARIRAEVPPR